jgi:hypothetical protein
LFESCFDGFEDGFDSCFNSGFNSGLLDVVQRLLLKYEATGNSSLAQEAEKGA